MLSFVRSKSVLPPPVVVIRETSSLRGFRPWSLAFGFLSTVLY